MREERAALINTIRCLLEQWLFLNQHTGFRDTKDLQKCIDLFKQVLRDIKGENQ